MQRKGLFFIVGIVLGCYVWTTGVLAQASQAPAIEAVRRWV
jgi:hypothetical protein